MKHIDLVVLDNIHDRTSYFVHVSVNQLAGTCIIIYRVGVRTPDTLVIHLEKGEF
jgi:hypothetical protein